MMPTDYYKLVSFEITAHYCHIFTSMRDLVCLAGVSKSTRTERNCGRVRKIRTDALACSFSSGKGEAISATQATSTEITAQRIEYHPEPTVKLPF